MSKPIVTRQSVEVALQSLFRTPQLAVLTIVGLIGLVVGMISALLEVTSGSGLTAISCGSVFFPAQGLEGSINNCGEPLSVAAIRSSTLVLGGVGLIAHSLLNRGFNRALLILGFTLIASLLLNFFEPTGGALDFAYMVFAFLLIVVAWRRGMAR